MELKNYIKIKRALLSVTDKTNLLSLAKCLSELGCELISTGGTAKVLSEAGIKYTEIGTVTGNPEAFGGRMKTISFAIESALLFDREKDKEEAERLGISPIDLVVCNLYDFEKYVRAGSGLSELIEHIDVGGPTMIRAGAKNFKYVAVVTDPKDYAGIIEELTTNEGALSYNTKQRLMTKAFNLTADYDAAIAQAMDKFSGEDSLRIALKGGKPLRYGENSHQQATMYRRSSSEHSLYDVSSYNGIELSYNNILDMQAAIETVVTLNRQGCVIVKHNNPCGMAESNSQLNSLELAWAGDTVSAFGGIVAFNTLVDLPTARFFEYDNEDKSKKKFIELITAPAFTDEALQYLKLQKNLRIVTYLPEMLSASNELRVTNDMALLQSTDNKLSSKMELATKNEFPLEEWESLISFGLAAVRHIKSNAIALVRATGDGVLQLIGMGSGQPNRLDSIGLAIKKAKKNLNVSSFENEQIVLISDAFFPFEDNVDAANEVGIKTLVQPGGSIRDKYVIERANSYGMNMILTGIRHFKH